MTASTKRIFDRLFAQGHTTPDIVRNTKGFILTRYSHRDDRPCLYEEMERQLKMYLQSREKAKKHRAEARKLRILARQEDAVAHRALFRCVQAGVDVRMSYREMSEVTGLSVSTLHNAWSEHPGRVSACENPEVPWEDT